MSSFEIRELLRETFLVAETNVARRTAAQR